jgi:hypothetical protein
MIKKIMLLLLVLVFVYALFFMKNPFGDEMVKSNLSSIKKGTSLCCLEKSIDIHQVKGYLYASKLGYFDARYCTRQLNLCKNKK